MLGRSDSRVSRSSITKVRFSIAGPDEILEKSHAEITSPDSISGGRPLDNGIMSSKMGANDQFKCKTCFKNSKKCTGHMGHMRTNYPVWIQPAIAEAKRWLKVVCQKCGSLVVPAEVYKKFPLKSRLADCSKLSSLPKKCPQCGEPHPTIKGASPDDIKMKVRDPLEIVAEYTIGAGKDKSKQVTTILPHRAAEILSLVTPETVAIMGRNQLPRKFITNIVPITPPPIRPDVKKTGASRPKVDDLTTMYHAFIRREKSMPILTRDDLNINEADPREAEKIKAPLYALSRGFIDIVKSGNDAELQSLLIRIKGKEGRIRKNLLGKRAHKMCRSIIYGDPGIKIDEIGLPLSFARTIQIREVVQSYNRARLMTYVQNGSRVYPGASVVQKKITGTEFEADRFGDRELEDGDAVWRDIIDGDYVCFNRQPTLKVSNISAMRVKVIHGGGPAIAMNVISCPLFDADFDGDAMNVIILTIASSIAEISLLSAASNWFISHSDSSPLIGQTEDSLMGAAELTMNGVEFDRYHAMILFRHTIRLPTFPPGNRFTGREIMSMTLEETPINFSRGTQWYKPEYEARIRFDPSDKTVNIVAGKILSGVLDKKSIGKGGNGNIYHIIANEYGSEKALQVMYDMQQIGISNMLFRGCTIGPKDLVISKESREELERIAGDMVNKSRLITEALDAGEIVPPIGKTVSQYYEELQINELKVQDDFVDTVLGAIDPENNNLMRMINFGSKGTLEMMLNMISAIGQKIINGERVRQRYGYKRSMPFFPRFDTSPISRGYIRSSYMTGLSVEEFISNAMNCRFDLISKALLTSITGDQMRKSVKNLESNVITNMRRVEKEPNVIQFAYGEDFIDARKLERVRFTTAMISDAAFSALLHPDFPEFNEAMRRDRDTFREIYMKIERSNINEYVSDEKRIGIDVARIIADVMVEYATGISGGQSQWRVHGGKGQVSAEAPKPFELKAAVSRVQRLLDDFPYFLSNSHRREKRAYIPEHYRAATWLPCMSTRAHLSPRKLEELAVKGLGTHVLETICERIEIRYIQALIAPGTAVGIISAQSFSAPLTQYILDAHQRSASGGTSKGSLVSTKEVLGAKETSALVGPQMFIPIADGIPQTEAAAREYANKIEMSRLGQFVRMSQIFYEKYGQPRHPKYVHERKMFTDFSRMNPSIAPPTGLVNWCVRFELSRQEMILKGMPFETIVGRLRLKYPSCYLVYTPENSAEIILRVYFRESAFKGRADINMRALEEFERELLDTIIRGVQGITSASPLKISRSVVADDGAVKRVDKWAVQTVGTNLREILSLSWVNKDEVVTEAVKETAEIFGIEAARQRLIYMIKSILNTCEHRHYLIYADEMTFTGKVTSVESNGLKLREASNVLLRVGFSSPMAALEEAAVAGAVDTVTGVTAPLILGAIPRIGTNYNRLIINEKFIAANVKKADDAIDALFD